MNHNRVFWSIGMQPRFALVALIFVSLALVAVVPACTSSSASPTPAPSPSPAATGDPSACNEADWAHFVPMQGEGLKDSTLQELVDSVDFHFVLPSCVPYAISNNFLLSTQTVTNENQAGLFLYPEDMVLDPRIRITQALASTKLPEAVAPYADIEVVSGIRVVSTAFPGPGEPRGIGTMLRYHWVRDGVYFEIEFMWGPPSPKEVSPDMKRQADELIQSLILAPEHP
jgi:hypothetical protein